MTNPFELLILALATWRLSHMLVKESGAFGILDRLRFYAGAHPYACLEQSEGGSITNVLCCVKCTSVWVALLLYLVWPIAPVIVYVLALSTGALVIDRVISS